MKNNLSKIFKRGIISQNPIIGLALGLCPALAVSTTVINAVGMGAAATFVLLGSNTIISSIKRFIPKEIRIPCFIVVIATFVTIVEMIMKAYFPALNESLGIFIPLIVVNCIILARAEAFASRSPVIPSIVDALGMGLGFSLALLVISAIREILGSGTILGFTLLKGFEPALVMVLPPGALLTLGLLIALTRVIKSRKAT
ncbi:MAG: electron transport complex subunit E [Candidatus Omnitrophota bacterium]